eukprot:247946_1
MNYKIQDRANSPLDRHRLWVLIKSSIWNTPVLPATVWLMYCFCDPTIVMSADLPTISTIVWNLVFFLIIEEIGFYYSHRMLHTPFFYGRIHKQHHEWTAPIALTAFYCHPVEHFLANCFPIALGPMLMNAHIVEWWMWISIGVLNSLSCHSGYHFPLMSSPEAHDFHHLRFNEMFGILGVLDWLHGTDKVFRQSRQGKLNKVYFSTAYKHERIRKVERIHISRN